MTTPIAAWPLDRRVRGAELYMDATDYEHELGNCTVALYVSVEDLKASRACVAECGIVAVRVEFLRVVEPGMPYSERGKSTPNASLSELKAERDALAKAIRDAAVKAGICRADVALTGPQLLMLCDDMATALRPNDQSHRGAQGSSRGSGGLTGSAAD